MFQAEALAARLLAARSRQEARQARWASRRARLGHAQRICAALPVFADADVAAKY
jgi:hypothetical protein